MRVLLVEDTDDLRHLLTRAQRKQGCTVSEAEKSLAALQAVRRFEPELVITDLMMPELDGVRLITLLKHSPSPRTSRRWQSRPPIHRNSSVGRGKPGRSISS